MRLLLSKAMQSSVDHRSVGWIEFDCEAGKDGIENEQLPFFLHSFPFSQRGSDSSLVKIRKVGDGKWMGVGERGRSERQ